MASMGWKLAALSAPVFFVNSAAAFGFETESWKGSLDSQFTAGTGIRLQNPSAALTGDPTLVSGANTSAWSAGDNGDLNYKRGHAFSAYVKLTTELLAHNPGLGLDVMVRGTGFYDPAAGSTERTELSENARHQVVINAQLLDLWAGHAFNLGQNAWRVRLGNQAINWGESVFLYGGINASSSIDFQKSLIPGTQIKEYVLPAPLLSLAGTLGGGWSAEGYYQFLYNHNRYPPVGSYWSTADYYGRGTHDPVTFNSNNFNATGIDAATIARLSGRTGPISSATLAQINAGLLAGDYANDPTHPVLGAGVLNDAKPGNKPQFGLALHYKGPESAADYGFYYIHYIDKSPVFNFVGDPSVSAGLDYQASYLKNRDLFGVSSNFPIGQWAMGAELSYRPRDAIALSGCFTPGQPLDANVNASPVTSLDCPLHKDAKKVEAHLTGQLTLTPSENPLAMGLLKAQSATFTTEGVMTYYSGVSSVITQNVEGVMVAQAPAAGGITWLDSKGNLVAVGTPLSTGVIADFNWTYDGTAISGWQLTPGVTYYRAVSGYTPNPAGSYLKGAQSVNVYLLLNQNPSVWQLGFNVTKYFGGDRVGAQPYADRGLLGAFVTRNF